MVSGGSFGHLITIETKLAYTPRNNICLLPLWLVRCFKMADAQWPRSRWFSVSRTLIRIFHKHVVPGPRNRYYRVLHVILSEDDKRSGNLSVCLTKLDVFKIRRYSK